MTYDIGFVLAILAISLVLFVSEKLRMDLVAMLVLAVLGVSGMVNTQQALEGFSNPAVVTVWAMFILSAGLSATGVADVIGRQVLRVAGDTEPRIILTIMIATGVMSAFMNNIGVAALMLPVVMDIARRTGTSPSRLLMPMAYASLLGGLTTMIGTPPNLVAATALEQAGYEPFSLFSFAPIGIPALIIGSLFVAFIGRHLLPNNMPHDLQDHEGSNSSLQFDYEIENKLFQLRVRPDSLITDRTLTDIQLGSVLGLNVYAVARGDHTYSDVEGDFIVKSNDTLLLQGSIEEFEDFLQWQAFEIAIGEEITELLAIQNVIFLSLSLSEESDLVGKEIAETKFSARFSGNILAVERDTVWLRNNLAEIELLASDRLIVETHESGAQIFSDNPHFSKSEQLDTDCIDDIYSESETLFELIVSDQSYLTGIRLAECGLRERLNLRIVGIARKSGPVYFPSGDERFQPGDKLLVQGSKRTADLLNSLQSFQVSEDVMLSPLDRDEVSHTEVTLSPRSSLVDRSIKDLNFRRRYGLQILAIWHEGETLTEHLGKRKLRFGDALLLSGSAKHIEDLGSDSDFLMLTKSIDEEAKVKSPSKAITASCVMAAVVLLVLFGVLPIAVAAIAGVVVMVATKCLSMDDAYQSIEWQSVFLIACMIPLGTAMQQSGAAQWIAEGVASVAKPFGPWGIIIGLYLVTSLATTIVPTTALVLIMAPIAIDAAAKFAIPPHMIIMAVVMAASASFTSPISHPANVLVMGPGGYKFIDYMKMGILLALIVMLTVLPMIALYDW